MYRILKPNKYAVIGIGNATYQGQEVKTVEFTIDYMTELGFESGKNILKLIFGLYNVMKGFIRRLSYGFNTTTTFSY